MGRTQLQRLTAEDERILELEHGAVVGHWCKVIIVDGALDPARVRDHVGRRLQRAPRLRQRLEFLPRGLGRPLWVDDPDFDLARHVAPIDTPAPLDDDALRHVVASRMQTRLDRNHPLWQLEVAPLTDERTALIWRVHHCMADGFTAMRIGESCIWGGDTLTAEDHRPARGGVSDSRGALLTAAALDRCMSGAREARAIARDLRGVRHWRAGLSQARAIAASARRELAAASIASCFDAPLGRRRAVAWRVLPLAAVHDAAKRAGAGVTLNDAVVALVASGVSAWLREQGRDSPPLRVRIPVSLHAGNAAVSNRDSFIDVDVPLDGAGVTARLRAINAQTAARKAAHDAEHVDEVLRMMAAVPFGDHLVALSDGAQHFSLCISNVVGPRQPIAVDGIAVSALHSIVEVAQHHDLRASVISCADHLSLSLCADADRVEPESVMRGVDAAWEQLAGQSESAAPMVT